MDGYLISFNFVLLQRNYFCTVQPPSRFEINGANVRAILVPFDIPPLSNAGEHYAEAIECEQQQNH